MTPEEALHLLDQAVSAALLTRTQHLRVQEAIRVLACTVRKEKSEDGSSAPDGAEIAENEVCS